MMGDDIHGGTDVQNRRIQFTMLPLSHRAMLGLVPKQELDAADDTVEVLRRPCLIVARFAPFLSVTAFGAI
jgi:hypothetical protein